jgi:transcriptional regulator with XRE-family HTH domain
MAIFNAGMMIRELRKAAGLTQAKLAEGICARQTITAIEKGERKPDWYIFEQIMRRLGVSPHQYFNQIADEDEVYIYNQAVVIQRLQNLGDYKGFKAEIEKMEQDKRFLSETGYTFLLSFKRAFYGMPSPYKNPKLVKKYAMEKIKLSRPNFDINKIQDYFLSYNEALELMSLICAYGDLGEIGKSIAVRAKLIESYERNYQVMEHVTRIMYAGEMLNQASDLTMIGRHEESIAMAAKGMAFALGDLFCDVYYMRMVWVKAMAHLRAGQKQEGETLAKQFLLYAYGKGENHDAAMSFEMCKKDFEKEFGYRLDLSLPW